jgi:biotin operon repressor
MKRKFTNQAKRLVMALEAAAPGFVTYRIIEDELRIGHSSVLVYVHHARRHGFCIETRAGYGLALRKNPDDQEDQPGQV